ncbi:50S ribosomal protein L27, partial [Lactobacillus crispatus]
TGRRQRQMGIRDRDDTLFALVNGVVKFERLGKYKKQVSVYPAEEAK